jgi:hypothetical protein
MWLRGALLLMLISLSACTWVELSPQGEQVTVATMEAVADCKRVGKTTVSTLSRVGGLNRYEESMQDELNKLARNSAVELGGDTVVPISPIEDGEQVFAVYRCKAATAPASE